MKPSSEELVKTRIREACNRINKSYYNDFDWLNDNGYLPLSSLKPEFMSTATVEEIYREIKNSIDKTFTLKILFGRFLEKTKPKYCAVPK